MSDDLVAQDDAWTPSKRRGIGVLVGGVPMAIGVAIALDLPIEAYDRHLYFTDRGEERYGSFGHAMMNAGLGATAVWLLGLVVCNLASGNARRSLWIPGVAALVVAAIDLTDILRLGLASDGGYGAALLSPPVLALGLFGTAHLRASQGRSYRSLLLVGAVVAVLCVPLLFYALVGLAMPGNG